MNQSEKIDLIMPALIKAQKEFKPAIKDLLNKHFGSKYSSISEHIKAILPALNENNLFLTQPHIEDSARSRVTIETRVIHESGQWIGSMCSLDLSKTTPQEFGTYATYMRKYSLQAIFSLESEDDDGQGDKDDKGKTKTQSLRPKAAPPKQTPRQEQPEQKPPTGVMEPGGQLVTDSQAALFRKAIQEAPTVETLLRLGAAIKGADIGEEVKANLRGMFTAKHESLTVGV